MAALSIDASKIKVNADIDTNTSKSFELPEPVFGNSPTFPGASAALEVAYAPTKGRYVVTKNDIAKGDVLFVEKPFAFVLLNHGSSNNLCAHCCRPLGYGPVP